MAIVSNHAKAAVPSKPPIAAADPDIRCKEQGDTFLAEGKFTDAAESYRHAIAINPRYAKAFCNLGFALNQLGQHTDAEECLNQALAIDPTLADAYYLLGSIHQLHARFDEAIHFFQKTLECDSRFEFAYRNLCLLLFQIGAVEQAREVILTGVEFFPHSIEFHFFLGNLYYAEKEWALSVASFQHALSIQPDYAPAYVNMAMALRDQGNPDQALEALGRAVRIDPSVADWHLKRGHILQLQQQEEQALQCYRQAIVLQPDFALAHTNLGSLYAQIGQPEQALASYRKALSLNPLNASMHFNVGSVLQTLGKLDEAIEAYRQALAIDASHLGALVNIASVLDGQKKYDDALACYNEALARYPEDAQIHLNKAYMLLRIGRYSEGWKEYEYRWKRDGAPELHFSQPLWLGAEDLSGKTILLHGEQGYGDMLHFVRYTKLVAAMGARVYLQVPASLALLTARCAGVTAVFAPGEQIPPFDFHCPLMSLPLACKTEVSTIPADIPYLKGDPARFTHWREKLGEKTGLRVGLAWAGDPRKSEPMSAAMDRQRSMRFENMLPLLEVHGVEFFSLQVGDAPRMQLKDHPQVRDFTSELANFQETAALVENLDLVISVDTSIVHLSGAIGKPVWILDRLGHCYRWLVGREDSPWYPNARIFRQPVSGDWESVIDHVRRALEKKVHDMRQ